MKISDVKEKLNLKKLKNFNIKNIKERLSVIKKKKQDEKNDNNILKNLKRFFIFILPDGIIIEKIYLIILFISFIALMYDGGASVNEVKVLIISVTVGGVFILRSLRGKVYFPKNVIMIFGAFIFITILSTVFSTSIYPSILRFIELFWFGIIIILGYDLLKSGKNRTWLMNSLLFALSIILTISIIFYIKDKTSLIFPLNFPVYLGVLILSLLPYSFISLLENKGYSKIVYFLFTLIFVSSIVLTFSRPIWVFGALEMILILILYYKKIIKNSYFYISIASLLVIASAIGILLFFKGSSASIPLNDPYIDRNLPIQYHLDILSIGYNIFKDHALIGIGPDTYNKVSLFYLNNPWKVSTYVYNDVFEFFITEGLIGGILFISLIGYILYRVLNKTEIKKQIKDLDKENISFILGILLIVIFSLYYPLFHVPVLVFILFLYSGAILRKLDKDNARYFTFGMLSEGVINGLVAILILISVYFVFTENKFQSIKTDYNNGLINISNVADYQKKVEDIVSMNPMKTDYSSFLSSLYIDEAQTTPSFINKAIDNTNKSLKYNKQDSALLFEQAVDVYYKDTTHTDTAVKMDKDLLNKVKYGNPLYYLLVIKVDQDSNNNEQLLADMKTVIDRYPLNKDFDMYNSMFSGLGYNAVLYQVYFQYGLMTKNNTYLQEAGKLNPTPAGQ